MPGTFLVRALTPGVVLSTVLESGFEYDGMTYRSPTAAARPAKDDRSFAGGDGRPGLRTGRPQQNPAENLATRVVLATLFWYS